MLKQFKDNKLFLLILVKTLFKTKFSLLILVKNLFKTTFAIILKQFKALSLYMSNDHIYNIKIF